MISTIMAAILDALNGDATLIGYLGGKHVYRGWINQAMHIPCVTVTENNESSVQRVGYATSLHRDNKPTVQIDVWISKSTEGFPSTNDDLDVIANRIDEFLFKTGITNTKLWNKMTSSEQFEQETGLFHKALRYNFTYSLTD